VEGGKDIGGGGVWGGGGGGGGGGAFSLQRFRDTPHSTNETGATNCYIHKTDEKHADRHENIGAMKWCLEHRAGCCSSA